MHCENDRMMWECDGLFFCLWSVYWRKFLKRRKPLHLNKFCWDYTIFCGSVNVVALCVCMRPVYLCVSVFFSVRVSVFVFNPCARVCFWACVRQYAKRTFQSRLLITTPRNVIRRCSAVPALCTARPARGLKCHLFGAEKGGGTYFNLAVVAEGKRNWNGCVKVVFCLILF